MEIVIKNKKPDYPYLGVALNGEVVLFEAPCKGTRLRSVSVWEPAIKHSTSWVEDNFKPFEGELKVSN